MENKLTVNVGNALSVNTHTMEAINKLPKACRAIALDITDSNNKARENAYSVISGIAQGAAQLTKETAVKVSKLVSSYEMTKDSPFKSWGEFAKEAWGKSSAWVSQNVGVAAVMTADGETAKILASNYSFAQIAELLPLCKNGIPPVIENAIQSNEISADMTAKEIREWVKAQRGDDVIKVQYSDIFFPTSGKRVVGILANYAPDKSTDDEIVVAFNPESEDDDGTKWRGRIIINRVSMLANVVLFHNHKEAKPDKADSLKHLDATDRLALSIREMPVKLHEAIVSEYMDDETIDFNKLCLLVGVDRNRFEH